MDDEERKELIEVLKHQERSPCYNCDLKDTGKRVCGQQCPLQGMWLESVDGCD